MKIRHLLPDEYSSFFETDLLDFQIHETKATCDACAKAPPKYTQKDYYEAHLKCCTYQPFLPNYAVGFVLSQNSENYHHAQAVLRKQIQERRYALPIGVLPSVKYQVEFQKNKPKIFGRDRDFLCPYYNRAQNCCSLWKVRGSVCTSFYCMSSYGASGQAFWKEMQNYLSYTEMLLMEECLVHLDYSPRDVSNQIQYLNRKKGTASELRSHRLTQKKFNELWKDRASDPEQFYIRCYEFVKGFSRDEFVESAGETGLEIKSRLNQRRKQLGLSKDRKKAN